MPASRRILAFDFSYGPLAAVLLADGRIVAATGAAAPGTDRAEALVPALDALLREAGWSWSAVDLLAVGCGPGSFTGIRAAVAAARGLALATGRPVLPLGTLDLLEQSARATFGLAGPLLVAAPGKRGSWYARRFEADGEADTLAGEIGTETLSDLAAEVGAVVGVRVGRLRRLAPGASLHEIAVSAAGLQRLVRRALETGRSPVAGPAVEPVYLRGADADPRAGLPLLERVAG
jgi:tRNA threonylcarbamoyl adenosine modification protein YeaZ